MNFQTTFNRLLTPFSRSRRSSVPSQRRRFRRVACGIAIRCASRRHGDLHAQVLDIAVGGLRLEIQGTVRPGEEVVLHYVGVLPSPRRPSEKDVRARVNWVRRTAHGCEAGLSWIDASTLLERSWVKVTLLDLGLAAHRVADSRRSVRASAAIKATLQAEQKVDATVRDLSVGGALVESSDLLPLGTTVRLQMPALNCEGRVVRHVAGEDGNTRLGIRFDHVSQQDVLGRTLSDLLRQ